MILGLDISTVCSGWAVIREEDKKLIGYGSIPLPSSFSFQQKIKELYYFFNAIVENHPIKKIVIEDQFFGKNVQTTKILSRISGVATLVGELNRVETIFIPPTKIKKIFTGKGNATKEEVRKKVLELYEVNIGNDDTTDAIATAYAYIIEKKD